MAKKYQIVVCSICVLFSVILSVITIILYFIPIKNELTATEIYNNCLSCVVEVKAVSDNIGESFGTGEILSSDGKIVTNAHVVTYSRLSTLIVYNNYYIRFAFEDEYREVNLEKYDIELDLAVLSLDNNSDMDLKPIKLGDSDNIKAGDTVYAVGNASNYGIGIFKGIISIPLINIELDGVKKSVIQSDLTIAAGNSGGALLDASGALVGITTFRTKDNAGNIVKTIPAPAITIDGIRYDTKVKTKSEIKALPRVRDYIPIYYLAFASGVSETNGIVDTSLPDGGLFIGSEISFSQAIEVLTTNVVSEVVRDGTTFTYIPSVYAYNESNILSVMDIVSYHSQTPRNNPEWHFIGNSSVTGFPHYHPNEIYDISVKKGNGTKSYRHHAFFLNFDVTTWLGYQYSF